MTNKQRKEKIDQLRLDMEHLKTDYDDLEQRHCDADNILLEILSLYNHKDIVDMFNDMDKWYA